MGPSVKFVSAIKDAICKKNGDQFFFRKKDHAGGVWRLACIQLGKQARKLQLLGRASEATEQCPSQVTLRLYKKTLSLILLPIRDIIKMNKSAVSTILCLFI